ncbi:MAG: leucyl aminopeptidase [Acidiferrobacteraceae bacterium]
MNLTFDNRPSGQRECAALAIGVYEDTGLSASAAEIDHLCGGEITRLREQGDLEGRSGQILPLFHLPNVAARRVLLVGCGKEAEFGVGTYREAVARVVRFANDLGCTDLACALPELAVADRDEAWKLQQAAEVATGAIYRFDRLKSKPPVARRTLQKCSFSVGKGDPARAQSGLERGRAIGVGMEFMRDLANLPGNICTPSYLAEQAQQLGTHYGLTVRVLEEEEMRTLGMGALLSVTRGSRQPPKLITIEYRGAGNNRPCALVGKGITFDSGGISIKPAGAMDEMKFDMSGAASVLGTLKAVAELRLPVNVVGVIPTCENMPDGNASKPGDIVTTMSGQTVEVLNTDAEGRLILCDALTYTERFEPEAVIDIATLTGACVIALGAHATGLLTPDDALAAEIIEAGEYAHDRVWRLPLWDDYQKQLDSNFADMANIGGREAGTVTAACFLSRFTKKFAWAHLDIAGVAYRSGKEKGSTARPVPLLTEFLIRRAARERSAAKR